jgi:hypothetical protein
MDYCLKEKMKTWFLGKFEGRRITHHQDRELGTDVWDSVRTGVSERLPSTHPATTSVRCVWTKVHTGVVTMYSDQPVLDRCVVFGFVVRWKDGFVSMINRNFMSLLMMGVYSRVCSGLLWGMRDSVVSDSGRRQRFFFWVGGIGNGKRRRRDPWSSIYVHYMSRPQTDQIYVFMFCVMSYIT